MYEQIYWHFPKTPTTFLPFIYQRMCALSTTTSKSPYLLKNSFPRFPVMTHNMHSHQKWQKLRKKTLWSLFMDGIQLSQSYRASTRSQFIFLPQSTFGHKKKIQEHYLTIISFSQLVGSHLKANNLLQAPKRFLKIW